MRDFIRPILMNRKAFVGLIILSIFILMAILGPVVRSLKFKF